MNIRLRNSYEQSVMLVMVAAYWINRQTADISMPWIYAADTSMQSSEDWLCIE